MMTVQSKMTTKCQTTIPLVVRENLNIGPGSVLEYVFKDDGVFIRPQKTNSAKADDPFVTFTEWASQNDEDAYHDL